ncbi:hypothetical protein ONZ45_g14653 [Pleurotus djamor]|nr:hypothetical protein ONZ45_g14653 [Pleurotus djamor]
MDGYTSLIQRTLSIPFHRAALVALQDPPEDVSNPLRALEDSNEDRVPLEPPIHQGVWCDGSQCRRSEAKESITGFRYCCIDCPPGEIDFCSTCIATPGQGIDHDLAHTLVQIPPTTCAVCQDVAPLELHSGDTFRGPYREISATAQTFQRISEKGRCGFCTFVWTSLLQYPPSELWAPSDDTKVTIRLRKPQRNCYGFAVVQTKETVKDIEIRGRPYVSVTSNVADQEAELEVYVALDHSHELPVGIEDELVTLVHENSGSAESLQLAKMWLENCIKHHKTCAEHHDRSTSNRPIRVLDLQGSDRSRVYLHSMHQIEGQYATLSYCWGPGNPGLFTSTHNLNSHQEQGIAIEDLPPTIRDAIRVTRELGLRYIWVDRLCIIQDSGNDWAHQAALMCEIYSGAALTLSADGARSASEGLFCANQTYSNFEYKRYRGPDGRETGFFLRRPTSHPGLENRVGSNDQAIDRRGWTMQERLMSRRVLHFTSDELIWECNTLTECECRRESNLSRRPLTPGRLNSLDRVYEHWRVLVRAYSKRTLTFETDKLLALEGLVRRFHQIIVDFMGEGHEEEYLAGLWRGDLAAQLAWKPPTKYDLEAFMKANAEMEAAAKLVVEADEDNAEEWFKIARERSRKEDWHRTDGYVAPSWSWAHLKGPISYLICYPATPFKSYVEILEAKTTPRIADEPTGQVVAGHVTLRGYMVTDISLNIMQLGFADNTISDLSVLSYRDEGFWIEIQPDDIQTVTRERGCDPSGLVVLLLGTKDWLPPAGGIMTGISAPCNIERKTPDNTSAPPLAAELVEVFDQGFDGARWSSYLLLAESKFEVGKFERIACFDVWGPQAAVMADLFAFSTMGDITII